MLPRCRLKQLGAFCVLLVAAPLVVTGEPVSPQVQMQTQATGFFGYSTTFEMRIHAKINRLEDLLQIVEDNPLSFGSFLPVVSGSITITPEGIANFGGNFNNHSAFHEGDHSPGEMTISGLANQTATLRFDGFTLLEGSGKDMLVSDFEFIDHQGNSLTDGSNFQFDHEGQFTLRYGATLTFAEGQEGGEYQGSANIVMNY